MLEARFRKYAGAGNDFIVIDGWEFPVSLPEEQMTHLVQEACDRTSIGSDGLIVIDRSEKAPFLMRFYNPDGSYGALCGNGARCATQAAKDFGLVPASTTSFEVLGAVDDAELLREEWVRVHFQDPKEIVLRKKITVEGKEIETNYVDLGSQHTVTFFEDLSAITSQSIEDFPIAKLGAVLRNHPALLPKGANANFIEVREDGKGQYLRIRTFERGVEGETLACGTGCMSSAIIANLQGRIVSLPIRLLTQSGEFVLVDFTEQGGHISNLTLEGSAKRGKEGLLKFDETSSAFSFSWNE